MSCWHLLDLQERKQHVKHETWENGIETFQRFGTDPGPDRFAVEEGVVPVLRVLGDIKVSLALDKDDNGGQYRDRHCWLHRAL